MTDNRPQHGGWYVVVELEVADRARVLYPPSRAIGPVSWTTARKLALAWDREFGANTATLTERPTRRTPVVRVSG